eukprot:TRINITY_DN1468_c0_g1_i3.p1 TRINITY_DN1468_c0_g1~~TRINITY_DN1468_c0_g1_i3.p1  ORF type:complete len:582 (-),score=161.46 TRINITY_DN1468_c0_g1_i3:256-1896(-)
MCELAMIRLNQAAPSDDPILGTLSHTIARCLATSCLAAPHQPTLDATLPAHDTKKRMVRECLANHVDEWQDAALQLPACAHLPGDSLAVYTQAASACSSIVALVRPTMEALETLDALCCAGPRSPCEASRVDLFKDMKSVWATTLQESETKSWPAGFMSLNYVLLSMTELHSLFDNAMVSAFIKAYKCFTTPDVLMSAVYERVCIPEGLSPLGGKDSLYMRVYVLMREWVLAHPEDFANEEVYAGAMKVIAEISSAKGTLANNLKLQIQHAHSAQIAARCVVFRHPATIQQQGHAPHTQLLLLEMLDARVIAEMFTCIDQKLLACVQPDEFSSLSWGKSKLQYFSTNVRKVVSRANSVSNWAASLVLCGPSAEARADIVAKLMKVCHALFNMSNFNSTMGLYAALSLVAVDRLKKTKALFSSEALQTYQEVGTVLNPSSSWKSYRAELAIRKPPAVPYVGVWCSDLTMIEDGNLSLRAHEGEVLVNIEKAQMLASVLDQIAVYQRSEFHFSDAVRSPLLSHFLSLPYLDEEAQYALSMYHEPRDPS